jgi:murein DD-endopeptidase MepM/ murein hydrolase activator NlpD
MPDAQSGLKGIFDPNAWPSDGWADREAGPAACRHVIRIGLKHKWFLAATAGEMGGWFKGLDRRDGGTGVLDHGKGPASPGQQPGAIELGNEPPLSVDGGPRKDLDRRRVSVRWLSGTILAGLCGAALMGGAVFAALDGEAHFAATPERAEPRAVQSNRAARKSDRLPPAIEPNSARHLIRLTTMTKVGEREVPRVRPFIKVSSNLALSATELSAKIPPYNPQRMLANMADFETPAAEEATGAAGATNAEVSFVTRDLLSAMPRLKLAGLVPMDEVMSKVREAANYTGSVQPTYALASINSGKLAYASPAAPLDPYAGFEARIIPENITMLAKTTSQTTTGSNSTNERSIVMKKGETLGAILRDLGATPDEVKAILAALGPRGRDGALKEGQKLKVLLAPAAASPRMQPLRITLLGDTTIDAVIALSDVGKYVAVDVQSAQTQVAEADGDDDDDDGTGIRLYQSIYETALRNQVPKAVVEELIRVYSYDVDFQRRAKPGDSFEVFYAGDEENPDAKTDVLFASLTVGGETRKLYHFVTPDDNISDYYDEDGKSAKKFLVRKPVPTAIMRSGFGSRRHPILGYTKMHTGVDWAAPLGTPISASGNGTIEKAGWESGYGKYIRIKHNNGYETAYGHMTAFARGMEPGARVRQGQVIGFVGSTGESTGSHVHFEILVNGRFVDPMRIKLPRGRVLEGTVLTGFEKERDHIEAMMNQPGARAVQSASR